MTKPTFIFIEGGLMKNIVDPPPVYFIIYLDIEGKEDCPLCYGKFPESSLICPDCGIDWDTKPNHEEIIKVAEKHYEWEIKRGQK